MFLQLVAVVLVPRSKKLIKSFVLFLGLYAIRSIYFGMFLKLSFWVVFLPDILSFDGWIWIFVTSELEVVLSKLHSPVPF